MTKMQFSNGKKQLWPFPSHWTSLFGLMYLRTSRSGWGCWWQAIHGWGHNIENVDTCRWARPSVRTFCPNSRSPFFLALLKPFRSENSPPMDNHKILLVKSLPESVPALSLAAAIALFLVTVVGLWQKYLRNHIKNLTRWSQSRQDLEGRSYILHQSACVPRGGIPEGISPYVCLRVLLTSMDTVWQQRLHA